ncbi:PREDICTED: uncharacterized protein LOC104825924 [Tarenaya hassleriana]|uniref:uncharacterized protein LOC104825924 n=1 Tax=Tarenaya hassleriana TaxID=28532 RepID=UPI00053C3414|nr:PREDICTED: uncharacterized protein LOC104825924 [Tarenaya hassleriana]
MAFDVHANMASITHEDDDDEDLDRNHHHPLSRLSICTNYEEDEGDNGDEFDAADGYADEELSDSENRGGERVQRSVPLIFSDSDKEPGCHSLPATPPRRRRRNPGSGGDPMMNSPVSGEKAYASENEAQKGKEWRRRRMRREYSPWEGSMRRSYEGNFDHGGVVVVTRPIGGGRALCMDLDEVKACKDLGFELEPGRVSYSADTSSGGNSPSSNWRISSPGDDPKDVKERLKAWAQAVAFVSASSYPSSS